MVEGAFSIDNSGQRHDENFCLNQYPLKPGSIYHVHSAWQVWHGQLSPRFKFNKLKSFSGVEIDQNHVDKRILGGKGLQYKGQEA